MSFSDWIVNLTTVDPAPAAAVAPVDPVPLASGAAAAAASAAAGGGAAGAVPLSLVAPAVTPPLSSGVNIAIPAHVTKALIISNAVAKLLMRILLSGFLLYYGVQIRVMYPDWVLRLYDMPLVRFVCYLLIYFLLCWDTVVGVLFSLCLLFIHLDMMIFGERT